MIVTALVAAAQWDALAIDVRDAAILEPLPVRAGDDPAREADGRGDPRRGRRARGERVSRAVVFPSLLVFNFRQMSFFAMLWLMATHAVVTIAAAVFGYLAVDRASRNDGRGPRVGAGSRASRPGRKACSSSCSAARCCCCRPRPIASHSADSRDWRAMSPPMWFLGAYEMTAGGADRRPAAHADDAAAGEQRQQHDARFTASGAATFPALAAARRRWPSA